ncbi:MAG: DUF1501 domain-containing protein [Planctomycetia bacterium]|nr:DUF1501 domain-containing protein [Planctomycetia bacterium]
MERRAVLISGSMAGLTASLPMWLQAQERVKSPLLTENRAFGKAKQVLLLFLSGGPPQHETFDPKPDAPPEIRGPFNPISTSVPGIQFCELLPRTARRAHQLAVVRSMFTNNNIHGGSGYWVLTGRQLASGDGENASPTDWPNIASIVKRLRPSERLPSLSAVSLPELFIGNGGNIEAGQFGGILGPQWSPEMIECKPADRAKELQLGGMYAPRVSGEQMRQRVSLLDALGQTFDGSPRNAAVQVHDKVTQQAVELLTSGGARRAFNLHEESDATRDRYGRYPWGQSVLLGRRLIEAGVRFVTVNWPRTPGDRGVDNPLWDTHARNFDRMEDVLAPQFDVTFAALLDDLSERGLLDETLVVAVGEFGRTPRVNANAGRDHWGSVMNAVLAGAGIAGGQVFGSSDKQGAYPATDPVDAGHLAATIFHLVGINTQGTFRDRVGRELSVTDREPLFKLLGEEPATSQRMTSNGDLVRIPPFREGSLRHTDFSTTETLLPADAPPNPKGWRASPLIDAAKTVFGVRLLPTNGALGVWSSLANGNSVIAAQAQAILAQQILDPQAGHFTVKAIIGGDGTSKEKFDELFLKHFRCRLTLFQFTQPTKSVLQQRDLHSLEFTPTFLDATKPEWQTVAFEKHLAPAAIGANFSFGLGIGVALVVERKTDGPLMISSELGDTFLRVQQVQVEFQGWKLA